MNRVFRLLLAVSFCCGFFGCGITTVGANDFYTATGNPATGSTMSSAIIRDEFADIEDGFDNLPDMTGNANEIVVVNPGATLLVTSPIDTVVNSGSDVVLNTTHRTSDGSGHSNVVLNDTHRGGDGSDHADVATNTVHVSSDGKNHSDVVLNNTHRASDGTDHSHVGLNDTHRTGDGSDHSDVVLNNTHRTSDGSDHADVATNSAARHAESHTVASHSDTTATGAELETLTDGSNADSLHAHSVADAHVAGDGTDHSHVGLNDTHRTSDGSGHSNVAINTSRRLTADELAAINAAATPTGTNEFVTMDDIGDFGGGDVLKVGTPTDHQVGVWTGDGTIEGTDKLLFVADTTFIVEGNTEIGTSNDSTVVRNLKIGNGRTGDGNSYIDLIGDSTYSSYGLRIIRHGGANSDSILYHKGTGDLILNANDAGGFEIKTNDISRLGINSNGSVAIKKDINIGSSADSTDERTLTIGYDRTGNGASKIDLISDSVSNYGLRLLRIGGANAASSLTHSGTGALQITTANSGSIELKTNNTNRIVIDSSGTIQFTGSTDFTDGLRTTKAAPVSASASGNYGEIRYDADYVYICTATDTWKRVAIETW